MALKIIGAEERLITLQQKNTALIVGPTNVGKTSLIRTLDPQTTLVVNLEAGLKAVQEVPFAEIKPENFREVTDIACLLGGPVLGRRQQDFFSEAHYGFVKQQYPEIAASLPNYRNLFVDSLTDLTRMGMEFAKTTPAAISERTGREDLRGAYGELARQTLDLLKHLQRAPMVNVFFTCILEQWKDEFGKVEWQMQLEGQRIGRELAGIVDNIFTMSYFDYVSGPTGGWVHSFPNGKIRALCCYGENPWGLPGKNRGNGRLDLVEEPNLTKIIAKLNPPPAAIAAAAQ